jgi:hypothetical protein
MTTMTIPAERLTMVPLSWRRKLGGNNFELRLNKQSVSIRPKAIERVDCWDAEIDNNGKMISANQLLQTLKKIRKEEDE